jgi:PAS domain S-box-containing protein
MASVLIIDDDPAVLTALPETLRLWMPGLLVEICASARLALDRIEATEYDAIISDIRMPDMDGLMLLERIRSLRPQTPTLLITGYGEQSLATQALRGGAYDYILKPIDRDYLLSSLTRALQLRRLTRQAQDHTHTDTPLKGSRESLLTLMETIPCMLVVVDADGRILFFNRTAEDITGFRREELYGTSLFEALCPSTPTAELKLRLLEGKPHVDPGLQVACVTKPGGERWIEWRCTPIAWGSPTRPCFVCSGFDMTDRRESERTIQSLNRDLDQRMQGYEAVVHDLDALKTAMEEKNADLQTFQEVVVDRELKMIALERQVAELQQEVQHLRTRRTSA